MPNDQIHRFFLLTVLLALFASLPLCAQNTFSGNPVRYKSACAEQMERFYALTVECLLHYDAQLEQNIKETYLTTDHVLHPDFYGKRSKNALFSYENYVAELKKNYANHLEEDEEFDVQVHDLDVRGASHPAENSEALYVEVEYTTQVLSGSRSLYRGKTQAVLYFPSLYNTLECTIKQIIPADEWAVADNKQPTVKKAVNENVVIPLTPRQIVSSKKSKLRQEQAYLMVYHKDIDHGLHMAISYDGYRFIALNEDKPVISGDTIAEQKGIRDPHIFCGPDGTFYLAMTDLHVFGIREGYRTTQWERDAKKYGWGNNRGLVLMKSSDLKHWTHTNLDFQRLGGQWSEVGCVWAPEICYDEERDKLFLHFTTRTGTGVTRIYYVYMNDDFTQMEGEPKLLFEAPEGKYSVIDSDIVYHAGTYHLYYVSHENGAQVKHATSADITGPYIMDENYYDGVTVSREGPNCWKRIGEDTWVVMHDNYKIIPHNFGFTETKDFIHYTPIGNFDEGKMTRVGFSEQKHGAVIHITKKEAESLEKYWNTSVTSKAQPTSSSDTFILHGTVVDKRDGLPVIGCTVERREKLTSKRFIGGAVTDVNGKFSLEVKTGDVLIFEYVGMETCSYVIPTQDKVKSGIKVVMKGDK